MDTVSRAYAGQETAAEKFTYFEYALGEEKSKDTDSYRQSEQYYSDMMKQFESVSEIPGDKKGRSEDGHLGIVVVPMEKTAVERFCKQNAVTPSSLFLAAAFYTVSRCYICKPRAVIKSGNANIFYAVSCCYACKTRAVIKRIFADIRISVPDNNARQAGAAVKSGITDTRQAAGKIRVR